MFSFPLYRCNFITSTSISDYVVAITTKQGRNHDFHFGGGLEVTIGGGLTMVEAEELKNLF